MTDRQPEFPIPNIDASHCSGCAICVRICPNHALMMKDGIAVVANPHDCTYAGHCERICPVQAISRPFQIIFSPKSQGEN
jgi:ferredoxin